MDPCRLRDAAIPALTRFGMASPEKRPRNLGARPFDRLRNQVRLQLEQYRDGEIRYELIPPDPEEAGRAHETCRRFRLPRIASRWPNGLHPHARRGGYVDVALGRAREDNDLTFAARKR